MRPIKEQLTVRGVIIGVIGSVIITASSVYVALKLGALPWPVFFVALLSLFALKLMGHTNINEVNVTHTAMSAGAMVAGGLAFSIPAVYMLFPDAGLSFGTVLLCAISGVALGLVFTLFIRKRFIESDELTFPIGQGAAETLVAGYEGGHSAKLLFGAMGVSALFAVLRDFFGLIPAVLFSKVKIPGVNFGVYCSLMTIGMGFMIGTVSVGVWFLGALIGNLGIVIGGVAAGLWDVTTAGDIKTSLGIGLMIGCGLGVVVKAVIGYVKKGSKYVANLEDARALKARYWAPLVLAGVVALCTFGLHLGIAVSLLLVALSWLLVSIAAQSVGQSGVNPMEVFGIIALLLIQLICHTAGVAALLIVAVVAVACGLCGDVMNDFKSGNILGSSPKAQWISEAIGAIVGAVVAAGVVYAIVTAYGSGAFGPDKQFVAAQATAVASMVGGISNLAAFVTGIVAGTVLYLLGAPVLMLGLGIYLPFYLSLTAAIGGLLKVICDHLPFETFKGENGVVVASGLMGGESIVGVIIAFVAIAGSFVV